MGQRSAELREEAGTLAEGAGRSEKKEKNQSVECRDEEARKQHELQIVDLNLFVSFCPVRAQKAANAQGELADAIRARP